mgnify:CR=1 FL=1
MPETRLILLDLVPERIDGSLALRRSLHQRDALCLLCIIELDKLCAYQRCF